MPVLTLVDVCSIQKFIFSSNRLTDIVARSQAVEWATSTEGDGALHSYAKNVIRAAGGNALLRFSSQTEAHEFAAGFSRQVYDAQPGMELAVVHREYKEGSLADAIEAIFIDLERAKSSRRPVMALPGLGVTVSCAYTGLPATAFDKRGQPVAASSGRSMARTLHKHSNLSDEHEKNHDYFTFTDELDKLGRTKNDTSYLGIVHIDGNKIGDKLKGWLKSCRDSKVSDNQVIEGYQKISRGLSSIMNSAFSRICSVVRQHINKPVSDKPEMNGDYSNLDFELQKDNNQTILPLRPVIIGGDDLTFVCDGRIALFLAQTALEEISRQKVEEIGKIGACAGVAFVKSHYPFSRGYELAEDLCCSAKTMLRKPNSDYTDTDCAIDWHIGNIRPGEAISDIREFKYSSIDGERKLTLRPYHLNAEKREEPGNWYWLSEIVLGSDKHRVGFRSELWLERRNKIKDMLFALKNENQNEFKAFVDQLKVVDPATKLPEGISDNGGTAGTASTSIIDAVELLDMHQTLYRTGGAA